MTSSKGSFTLYALRCGAARHVASFMPQYTATYGNCRKKPQRFVHIGCVVLGCSNQTHRISWHGAATQRNATHPVGTNLNSENKNLSGDEIANVKIFTTISHTYFKIPIKRTYFV